MPNNK